MLSAHVVRFGLTNFVGKTSMRQTAVLFSKPNAYNATFRQLSNQTRNSFTRRTTKSRTLKEIVTAPAGEGAFSLGKGLVLGASGLGLGALCFYGLGFGSQPGAIDRSVMWPEYVKERIRSTYMYFGGSVMLTAASAVACFRSPLIMRVVAGNSMMVMLGSIAVMIGTGMLVRSIPYQPGVGSKQAAWALHSAVIGAVIAPMCFLGGPLLLRAAMYTAGIVGGLSTVAVCAPSEKFLNMGGPLAIGFGAVFAASIGSAFLPPTTALGAGLYSIALYGGLVLFSAFLLYDTQKIVKAAEVHSPYAARPFDPVNASISIYMDTINIFVRIATILAGGGNKRR
ncbi:growth hormone-inducible transmembrane protein-like [Daphnia pulicaria]|uniref:growth hormone-inducible transmembrane protein-like n=1 Tax=Daphnia pulicaria TaxID=35523 RepID=UPI001EEBAF00|nr:growth hormone-inducible transmembrane protein-like [Daphnia pulicaria]XP_046636076.1 growth hormone-inducible transmembrane protein-like [Daphnia pulicaria]XP_046636077.1 growth hormone-inducible transmembrane protein-like [Daphnia pulicaria]